MFKDNTKYFTITDIINSAISKVFQGSRKKDSNELSLHIINDMTYSNIWSAFVKWCVDQAELGCLLNVYPLGTMFYVSDKQFEGISIKVSDAFLKENDLKWDETKFYYEKIPELKFNASMATIQKLNLLAISSEVNLPKVYVQSGLNNLFKSIAALLNTSNSCLIDMGLLGNLYCLNKTISHIPSKLKKEVMFNRKTTIKTLMGKFQDDLSVNNVNDHRKSTIGANLPKILGSKKSIEINENKNTQISNINLINNNNNIYAINSQSSIDKVLLQKMRTSVKIHKELQEKSSFSDNLKEKDKILLIPLRNEDWKLKDMLDMTFKRADRVRRSNSPILFNAYSNTKAAPFTSEKTQIPISHRIASFYSLPLQNFIIDKTTKSIKRLYDEYFYKYKTIIFEIPATEDEEYESLIGKLATKKVALRKETYERYLHYIYDYITDDTISEIKENWLVNIVKMCMRAYDLNDPDKYKDLLNNCIREIIYGYKISMKRTILDYILKHPEQREKLNIPAPFRKLKEYAQDKIARPSDGDLEWKRIWNLSKLRISNNLMILSENVTKILKYFTKHLKNTFFLDLVFGDWSTLKLSSFIDNQKTKIEAQKTVVGDEWKKYVENLLKENKIYKDQLILYFKSVSGLMSSQLRHLIVNSLDKYFKFIQGFRKKKYNDPKEIFEKQFNANFPFERSFLEVEIISSNDGITFCFSDELSDIHNKLLGLVHEVVKCSQDIERPDNMFIKNLEKRTHLWEVPINDSVVNYMVSNIDSIIKENLDAISKVLGLYDPFLFVLTEQLNLDRFKNSNPKREDIKKKIKFYEDKLQILREDMPNDLYMNMIKINCTEINKDLRDKLYDYICDLLKYVQAKNINGKAKELNDRIEKLRGELNTHAQDEESLSKLENDLEIFKIDQVPTLYNEYNDFLEWVFFYLDYDIYPIYPDTTKESVGGIETTIRTAHSTVKLIAPAMDAFETNLKEKRAQLETQLNKARTFVNLTITQLRKDVEVIKENANSQYHGDETGSIFLNNLKALQKRTQEAGILLQSLMKREELLGSYPTEDDRIDQCNKDLEPMISYVSFYYDYKNIQADLDYYDIKSLEFSALLNLIERSTDLFDVSMQKIPSLKARIARVKNEFDSFRLAVELGKYIYSLIEILKYEHLSEDNKTIFEDNNYFCVELVKIIQSLEKKDNHKAQEHLKHMKLKELIANKHTLDKYTKNKIDIEKLVLEWENVRHMYDVLAKIAVEVDDDFKTESFKDKKYMIIPHDNYVYIKNLFTKNILIADENVQLLENCRDKVNITKKVSDYKSKLEELLEIIKNMESNQLLLEKHMSHSIILQKKNTDLFLKLKQAEKDFKILIDYVSEKTKIMAILSVKDFFRETLISISNVLSEIPTNYEEMSSNN